jgi:hypothetical protein
MSTSQLNPAQHVERIREIIMGRDLNQVHGRLKRIESDLNTGTAMVQSQAGKQLETSFSKLQEEYHRLKLELHQEKIMRKQQLAQIDQHLREMTQRHFNGTNIKNPDDLGSEMAARIDVRFREMMSHLQTELLQWKGQLDRDVMIRFAKIANAAMEDGDGNNPKGSYFL